MSRMVMHSMPNGKTAVIVVSILALSTLMGSSAFANGGHWDLLI